MLAFLTCVALQTSSSWSAHWRPVTRWERVLDVAHGRLRRTIHRASFDITEPGRPGLEVPPGGLKFRDHRFVPGEASILDSTTGQRLHLPEPPWKGELSTPHEFVCKGAMSLGKTMAWIFAWDMARSIKPSGSTWAYEIGLSGAKTALLRAVAVPDLDGFNLAMTGARDGDDILLVTSDERFMQFDVRRWIPISTADHTFSGPTGNIFRSTLGRRREPSQTKVYQWSLKAHTWVHLRDTPLGVLHGVARLDGDDLLVFNAGLMLARSGASVQPNPPMRSPLYIDPSLGVGFDDVFLGTDLRPRCAIVPVKS